MEMTWYYCCLLLYCIIICWYCNLTRKKVQCTAVCLIVWWSYIVLPIAIWHEQKWVCIQEVELLFWYCCCNCKPPSCTLQYWPANELSWIYILRLIRPPSYMFTLPLPVLLFCYCCICLEFYEKCESRSAQVEQPFCTSLSIKLIRYLTLDCCT